MIRSLCLMAFVVVGVLLPAPVVGQSTLLRVLHTASVLDAPTDGALVATVVPGTALELLDARGAWYLIRPLADEGGAAVAWRTGWIHQAMVAPLDEEEAASGPLRFVPSAPPPTTPLTQARTPVSPEQPADPAAPIAASSVPRLTSGMVEILADARLGGTSVAGEQHGALDINTIVAVLASSLTEFGVTFGVRKEAGLDTVGSLGGVFVVNLTGAGRAIPFVAAGIGGGFGYPDLTGNPFLLDVSGGVRLLTPGGGGAVIIRPFYQRQFFSGEFVPDVNAYGVSIGVSILVGGH